MQHSPRQACLPLRPSGSAFCPARVRWQRSESTRTEDDSQEAMQEVGTGTQGHSVPPVPTGLLAGGGQNQRVSEAWGPRHCGYTTETASCPHLLQ